MCVCVCYQIGTLNLGGSLDLPGGCGMTTLSRVARTLHSRFVASESQVPKFGGLSLSLAFGLFQQDSSICRNLLASVLDCAAGKMVLALSSRRSMLSLRLISMQGC